MMLRRAAVLDAVGQCLPAVRMWALTCADLTVRVLCSVLERRLWYAMCCEALGSDRPLAEFMTPPDPFAAVSGTAARFH